TIDELAGEPALRAWQVMDRLQLDVAQRLDAEGTALRISAEDEAADARRRERTMALLVTFVLGLAVLVTVVASRSISRPLRRLAAAAEDMAGRRLPDAVRSILGTPSGDDVPVAQLVEMPKGGGHEAAAMARALDLVQSSAAGLAVEQALLRR